MEKGSFAMSRECYDPESGEATGKAIGESIKIGASMEGQAPPCPPISSIESNTLRRASQRIRAMWKLSIPFQNERVSANSITTNHFPSLETGKQAGRVPSA
jgi:hypothetical protein